MISKIFLRGAIPKVARKAFEPIKKNLLALPLRAFASGKEITPEKGKIKLMKALSRELKYETENFQQDDSVATFLKENGYKLKDEEGSNCLELSKKVGDTSVVITFQSRSPELGDDENPEEEEEKRQEKDAIEKKQEEDDEAEGEGDSPQDFCDFTVYLIKKDGRGLAYDCTSVNSEIEVNFVNIVEDVEGHKKQSKIERAKHFGAGYTGPEFTTLDERLKTGLIEYLKGYGVNEELAVFIEHVSLEKEQRLYMSWLKNVHTFIENV